MPYEELSDLVIRKVRTSQIKPESFSGQPAAVHELHVGVEMSAILGHSRGV
jgi:hypothetical protein